jgi:nuclease A inhibitor-like protein
MMTLCTEECSVRVMHYVQRWRQRQRQAEPAAPLEPFVWKEGALTPAVIRRRAGHPAQVRCQTLAADAFFADLAEVTGFAALYATLQATLTDLQVYLFGEVTITVYTVPRRSEHSSPHVRQRRSRMWSWP